MSLYRHEVCFVTAAQADGEIKQLSTCVEKMHLDWEVTSQEVSARHPEPGQLWLDDLQREVKSHRREEVMGHVLMLHVLF